MDQTCSPRNCRHKERRSSADSPTDTIVVGALCPGPPVCWRRRISVKSVAGPDILWIDGLHFVKFLGIGEDPGVPADFARSRYTCSYRRPSDCRTRHHEGGGWRSVIG